MTTSDLGQFALDWDRIVADWQRQLEAEMDAAFNIDEPERYRRAALLVGQMKSARNVMRSMVTFPHRDPVDAA